MNDIAIKFRAYCEATGKWYDRVLASNYEDGPCSVVWVEDRRCWLNHDGPIMQYTGLNDKNGIEIYEKYIIMCGKCKWIVKRYKHTGGFAIYRIGDDFWTDSFNQTLADVCEVVGNIYEHPHLLEAQK